MKVNIQNLGPIREASVKIRKSNYFFGPNNTGKTYLSYVIWALINQLQENLVVSITKDQIKELLDKGKIEYDFNSSVYEDTLKTFSSKFMNVIPNVFNSKSPLVGFSLEISELFDESYFNESRIGFGSGNDQINYISNRRSSTPDKFILEIQKIQSENNDSVLTGFPHEVLIDILGKMLAKSHVKLPFSRSFAITSERAGICLFYKNLDKNKSELIDYIIKSNDFNPMDIIKKMASRYAMPIQFNIDFVREYENRLKKVSDIYKDNNQYQNLISAYNTFIGGSFTHKDNSIYYSSDNNQTLIPLHMASSTIKSLLLLDIYLRHEQLSGDILFFDEPELNLSAKNQVKIANLLINLHLANMGVFVTTHSDYIIRELNINSSLLGNNISLYEFDDHSTIHEIISDDSGFNVNLFDDVLTDQFNRANN